MWQRFTERAKRLVFFAHEEAQINGDPYVKTEHLLLAITRENDSGAVHLIHSFGVTLERIRTEVEIQSKRGVGGTVEMQLTPGSKRVLELAQDESELRSDNHIGTEHILLGLLREDSCVGGNVLRALGFTLVDGRKRLRHIQLDPAEEPEPTPFDDVDRFDSWGRGHWQRFTENARKTMFFAQEEARRLGDSKMSTEHLLLGLLHDDENLACRVFESMGLSVAQVRSRLDQQIVRGAGQLGHELLLTPRVKRVIDLAYDEARSVNNNYIGAEHLLLGLIREGQSAAAQILIKLGVDLENTRVELQSLQIKSFSVSTIYQSKTKLVNNERTTPRMLGAFEKGYSIAESLNCRELQPEHLLLALLQDTHCVAVRIIESLEASPSRLFSELQEQLSEESGPSTTQIAVSQESLTLMKLACVEADGLKDKKVGSSHFLMAMLNDSYGVCSRVLIKNGITLDKVRDELLKSRQDDL